MVCSTLGPTIFCLSVTNGNKNSIKGCTCDHPRRYHAMWNQRSSLITQTRPRDKPVFSMCYLIYQICAFFVILTKIKRKRHLAFDELDFLRLERIENFKDVSVCAETFDVAIFDVSVDCISLHCTDCIYSVDINSLFRFNQEVSVVVRVQLANFRHIHAVELHCESFRLALVHCWLDVFACKITSYQCSSSTLFQITFTRPQNWTFIDAIHYQAHVLLARNLFGKWLLHSESRCAVVFPWRVITAHRDYLITQLGYSEVSLSNKIFAVLLSIKAR